MKGRKKFVAWATLLLLPGLLVVWAYLTVYRISVPLNVAKRITLDATSPTPVDTTVTWVGWQRVWVGFGGYLHRDWEMRRFACTPGPSRCTATYIYTVFVNGQTSAVDANLIGLDPGMWPLVIVSKRPRYAH